MSLDNLDSLFSTFYIKVPIGMDIFNPFSLLHSYIFVYFLCYIVTLWFYVLLKVHGSGPSHATLSSMNYDVTHNLILILNQLMFLRTCSLHAYCRAKDADAPVK